MTDYIFKSAVTQRCFCRNSMLSALVSRTEFCLQATEKVGGHPLTLLHLWVLHMEGRAFGGSFVSFSAGKKSPGPRILLAYPRGSPGGCKVNTQIWVFFFKVSLEMWETKVVGMATLTLISTIIPTIQAKAFAQQFLFFTAL